MSRDDRFLLKLSVIKLIELYGSDEEVSVCFDKSYNILFFKLSEITYTDAQKTLIKHTKLKYLLHLCLKSELPSVDDFIILLLVYKVVNSINHATEIINFKKIINGNIRITFKQKKSICEKLNINYYNVENDFNSLFY